MHESCCAAIFICAGILILTTSMKFVEFMSDTCYTRTFCSTPVSEMKPWPGMLIVVESVCYSEQQDEHNGKKIYDHESEVRRKNYLKYCEYTLVCQLCDVYI
jgi:hypothetical protein